MTQAHYSMVIEWSAEDAAFIVTIPELPGAQSHAASYAEAADEGQRLIDEWLEIARQRGWPLPEPRAFASA
jgi:predicted RNase H-like HicB family nuclease